MIRAPNNATRVRQQNAETNRGLTDHPRWWFQPESPLRASDQVYYIRHLTPRQRRSIAARRARLVRLLHPHWRAPRKLPVVLHHPHVVVTLPGAELAVGELECRLFRVRPRRVHELLVLDHIHLLDRRRADRMH